MQSILGQAHEQIKVKPINIGQMSYSQQPQFSESTSSISKQSKQSSYCSQCHRQIDGQNHVSHYKLGRMPPNPEGQQHKQQGLQPSKQIHMQQLEVQVLRLKHENQNKLSIIQQLQRRISLSPSDNRQRKTSVQLQIQDNKKTFQMLKSSLLSFGNQAARQSAQTATKVSHQQRKQDKGLSHHNKNKTANNYKQHREHSEQDKKGISEPYCSSLNSPPSNALLSSTDIIIVSLQKRLREYQIELIKLIEKVELHEKSTEWMYHFIDSFIKMVLEINRSGRYGSQLVLKELSLKKKTKHAWKYLKDVLDKLLN